MKKCDIAVIGCGPAGLTAAVYASRAGYSAALYEGNAPGGQMLLAHEIENYSGFPKISGMDLADAMTAQAAQLGAEFVYAPVERVSFNVGSYTVTAGGESVQYRAVIVASGTDRRKLQVPGEAELAGRGVSYCAVCDGRFFKDKDVAVIGGGNTALGDALYLARICRSVTLVHRRDTFRADRILVDRLAENENIRTLMCARVERIEGDGSVESLVLTDTAEGHLSAPMVLPVNGVFVAVGSTPQLSFMQGMEGLSVDAVGYLVTDERCRTSLPGLFAAGDVRSKSLRQIATAVSDGAIAAVEAAEYLESRKTDAGTSV